MATVALEKASKEELVHKLKSLGPRLEKMREKSKHAMSMVAPAIASTAGGAVSGVLAVKMPTVPGTDGRVPTDAALAAACVLAAALDMGGKHNELLSAFGGGLGAVAAARMTENMLRNQ